jgi:hypothetical protein
LIDLQINFIAELDQQRRIADREDLWPHRCSKKLMLSI